MKLRNSWESLPKKTGTYFTMDHCGLKRVRIFEWEDAEWFEEDGQYGICHKCEVFEWIDMEEE